MALFKDNRALPRTGLIAGLAAIAVVVGVFLYPDLPPWLTNGPSKGPTERIFELEIKRGKVSEDMRAIRIRKDDAVRLRCTTDAPVVLHLHGYDIEKKVTPGRKTEIDFKAHATGRYPVSVHRDGEGEGAVHDEAPLAMIEVYPR